MIRLAWEDDPSPASLPSLVDRRWVPEKIDSLPALAIEATQTY